MQPQWIEPAVVGTIIFVFLMFLLLALRRARARRRAEFEEIDAPRGQVAAEAAIEGVRELAPDFEDDLEELAAQSPVRIEPAEAEPAAEIIEPAEVDAGLQEGLAKTHASLWSKLGGIFNREKVDASVLDELEEALLTADVGVQLTMRLVDGLRASLKANTLASPEAVRQALKAQITAAFAQHGNGADPFAQPAKNKPRVILFVGVNGVGKTTSIGKIAAKLTAAGELVVLAAGDTFRAAAAEQLAIWAERSGCQIIRGEEGSDPASVIFKAIDQAKASGADTVLADTAGRLHTKKELMDEIQKVKRAASKAREGAPDETWLVVDATTGQNALQQAKEFHAALGLTGVILTKLDGTAKGGIVVAIADALDIPVRFVGIGEQAKDLRPFDPQSFVSALFQQ